MENGPVVRANQVAVGPGEPNGHSFYCYKKKMREMFFYQNDFINGVDANDAKI
ncbi:hypothetical protein KFK09_020263 [Dendrobium nobile]|uniref:Uncharacterized protein n=1 Tax=Dendrobium nobile TaxID=94219 RepID=A0A8T3ATB3_DENNO|nr:hypothetical protein KFK09_020263 [Dendrobium nobile]